MNSISIKKNQFFFILCIFIFNVLHAFSLPLIDDEAYYWVWSNHLDFGYYDHPPMIALFIKIGYFFIHNELGVRLLSCISNIFFYLIWLKILKPKNTQENYLFLGVFGSSAIFNGMGFISTPDVPLLLFGSLFLLYWKNFLLKSNAIHAFCLGISMALTMYSKYHGAILILFAFLPAIPSLVRNKWFYFSIFLSVILYLPHIIWQYNHDWISVQYHLFERNKKELKGFPTGAWLLGLFLISNPLLLYFYGKSLFQKIKSNLLWEKSLQWICLGTLIFFCLFSFKRIIQPQWNLIIYMALIPLTYLTFKNKNVKLIKILSFSFLFLLFLFRIIILFPVIIQTSSMYKFKQFVLRANEVNKGIAVFERYQKAALFNFYNQKPAVSLQAYAHRASQYDVWNSEQKLQGKPITFFGLEAISSNCILNENEKKEFYKFISSFHSYPKIKITVTPKILNSSLNKTQSLDIVYHNPYNKNLVFNQYTNQEIGIIYIKRETLEPIAFVPITNKIILPSKKNISSSILINIPYLASGKYLAYIVLKPYGISGKIISNEMTIDIY